MKKAAATRLLILQKAFELIYEKGYQTTSVDDIIAKTQVTKGAFYYHFKNKDEMGLAIINELLKPTLSGAFVTFLKADHNPLDGIYKLMQHLLLQNKFLTVESGCPAGNFVQEMSPWNTAFNEALTELTQAWTKNMTTALEKGKKAGLVKHNVNTKQVVVFVMAGYWGVRNFGKLANNKKAYTPWLKELKNYLDSLR